MLPEGHLVVDAGMYVPVESPEHFRDICIEVEADEREYAFQVSNLGNLNGDLPPRMALDINYLMNQLKEEAGQ